MHWTREDETQATAGSVPSPSAVAAAVSLLVDPDPKVVAACHKQLLSWGVAALAALRQASDAAEPLLRLRSRNLLRQIELRSWEQGVQRFASAVRRAPDAERLDHRVLEAGVLLLSSLGRAEPLERREVTAHLERLGQDLRVLQRGRPRTAASSARALRELLGRREGFSSLRANHYDLRNVVFDSVARSGEGTAVALTVLYLLVGRRAGMCLSAVQLPGRMLVRIHGTRSVLIDPARGGRTVTNADCARELRAGGYRGASAQMQELGDQQVLVYLLESLQRVYGYREDREILRIIGRAKSLLASN